LERWTRRSHDLLPSDVLATIRPFAPSAAAALAPEAASRCEPRAVSDLEITISAEWDAPEFVRDRLAALEIPGDAPVILSWGHDLASKLYGRPLSGTGTRSATRRPTTSRFGRWVVTGPSATDTFRSCSSGARRRLPSVRRNRRALGASGSAPSFGIFGSPSRAHRVGRSRLNLRR
jgi:hypothetical protein